MSEKVKIDQDECIGCEACVELCPSVFSFDDNEEKEFEKRMALKKAA